MEKIIEFKTEVLIPEFEQIDNRLRFIIYALAGFVYNKFGKRIMITELLRTQEMQDYYYKDNVQYQKAKWHSVHEYGRGADISIKNFTNDDLVEIAHFINSQLPYNVNSTLKSLLIHDVNHGAHIHLQVNSYKDSVIRKEEA